MTNVLTRSSYAGLPERFFARVDPTRVAMPHLLRFNEALAAELGLDLGAYDEDGLANLFSGNVPLPGAEPVAMAYAGHQFGHFVPQLGDGRALLLGELRPPGGVARDVQLKGSGRTPYSRGGDGRAALGPVLREYLVSEAMHALGIPTTRALAAVTSGEPVYREEALPGAVLTRVAASFVRVGTFQFPAARGDVEGTRLLADYTLSRHYPGLRDSTQPYLELLRAVANAQCSLIAQWMSVGFIHGVMNTDNMAVSGETIDFGPCAFMDQYDPAAVFSSIDRQGRYAFENQPHAAAWNLARLAETLLPLIDPMPARAVEQATEVLAEFGPRFADAWLARLRLKLGLSVAEQGDSALAEGLLDAMHRNQADFTLTFRRLCDAAEYAGTMQFGDGVQFGNDAQPRDGTRLNESDAKLRASFTNPNDYDAWSAQWRARLSREPMPSSERARSMRQVNPAFIPRNHRIEQLIEAAQVGDFQPFDTFSRVLARPYEEQPGFESFSDPPKPDERVLKTFCGT